ncbi:MAG: hypothetical protein ACREM3_18135 [Candidatus Rokuibacteriota bacterium]
MQADVWYDLALRHLTGTDDAAQGLLRDAEIAGAPENLTDDAEEEDAAKSEP